MGIWIKLVISEVYSYFRAENLSAQDRGNGVETGTRDIYALDLTSADGILVPKFLIQHQDLVLVTDTEITAVGTALKFLASITEFVK